MEKDAALTVKAGAAKTVKAIAADIEAHRDDKSVLATWKGGNLTAARLVQWISVMPPQARIREQLASAPDTAIPGFIQNVSRNELVLRAADSVKVTPDAATLENVRAAFRAQVMGAMNELKVAPFFLKDSAKTEGERERLAASRIDAYFGNLLQEKAQFINVAEPVQAALRDKFESRIVMAGVERALEKAIKIRQVADSTRATQQPQSAVPMPGAPMAAPQPQAQPAPQPAEPVKKP
jgi:hypothetical protein